MQKNEFEKFGKYSLCEKNGRLSWKITLIMENNHDNFHDRGK